MRLFSIDFMVSISVSSTDGKGMPYVKVSRPPNAIPDSVAWRMLGLSRATFFRKLKEGVLTAPITRSGTSRRWWTPADIETARQELGATVQEDKSE
jgi:predicted DNA-binding transcriptional regulator AlpA